MSKTASGRGSLYLARLAYRLREKGAAGNSQSEHVGSCERNQVILEVASSVTAVCRAPGLGRAEVRNSG